MYKNVTYSVHELFDRAWSTPILQLARENGVSDVALSKACRKAGISLPRAGTGQSPTRSALRSPPRRTLPNQLRFEYWTGRCFRRRRPKRQTSQSHQNSLCRPS